MILSQADAQPPDHTRREGTVCTLALCLILSLVISAAFALCRAEVKTGFHRACLNRFSDIGQFALPRVYDTLDDCHPFLSHYAKRNHTFAPTMVVLLVKVGLSFEMAVSAVSLVYRCFFGIGISWLVFAVTGRRGIGLLGVFLAYGLPYNVIVYGCTPDLSAITGVFAISVFLVAVSLCLLGLRRSSLVVWLFQLWVHPITFVCWAPVFLALFLTARNTRRTSSRLWSLYLVVLVCGPLATGLIAGLLERASLLPFRGDEYYWALVRVKTYHSVFLFTSKYAAPLQYLSQVLALLLLARSRKGSDSPLVRLNMLTGCLGLGIGLMYIATVETHFSVLANMCLPLRFEAVMYPLLVANVLHVVCCSSGERTGERVFAATYGALLLFPSVMPLFWAAAWAAGIAWFQGQRRHATLYLMAVIPGIALALLYLVTAPSEDTWLLAKLAYTMSFVKGLLWLVIAFGVSLRITHLGQRAFHVVAWAAVLLIPSPNWILRWQTLAQEVSAIVHNLPVSSPTKKACDWINANIPAGSTILVAPKLYLHYATHVKTSIELELVGFFIYAPATAKSIAEEVNRLYGVDVLEVARRHQRLRLSDEDWYRLRRGIVDGSHPAKGDFQYVGEPAGMTPADSGVIVFQNEFLRVYSLVTEDPRTVDEHHEDEPQNGPGGV
ncbi:MAG: hypothetical protein V3R87_12880 [Dehalococcoidia bacterium]